MEALPKDCIEAILSRTTPSDVCRLSSVSKAFYSAAYSNAVWDAFFPSSFSFVTLSHDAPFKKALYLALSQQPIIINDNKMSFQLDRKTGKKCYMLSARSLDILWDDSDLHWKWLYMPGSRFAEVAQLLQVYRLEIHGMINTSVLSPNTRYAAYLVFKMIEPQGFDNRPVELSVGNINGHGISKTVCLDPNAEDGPLNNVEGLLRPILRNNGWLEIEMGEFYNSGLEDEEMQLSVLETNYSLKRGLFVEGIEVRPKEDN